MPPAPDRHELLERCLERLRAGSLSEDDLRELAGARPARRPQSLLYLQAAGTSPLFPVHGMALYVEGEQLPVPRAPEEWPYRRVADALRDGWRIIAFPNTALLVDEGRTYGLGCEFILER